MKILSLLFILCTATVLPGVDAGEHLDGTLNHGSGGNYERDEDTRISPTGGINAASAAEQLLTSSGLPCTEYMTNVVRASGINPNYRVPGKNYNIKDAISMNRRVLPEVSSNDDLDDLVRAGDERTKGVVNALTSTDQGTEIDISADNSALKRGDLVQYWYVKGGKRLGHTAVVVVSPNPDGTVFLKGSQQGTEGIFKTSLSASDYKYAVRPKH